VFDAYRSGVTISGALEEIGADSLERPPVQSAIEQAVLDLIAGEDSPAIERAA
jgi:hypothetical protein